jgi:hypothetical protein
MRCPVAPAANVLPPSSNSLTGLVPIAFNATTVDHVASHPTESVRTSSPIMSLVPSRITTIQTHSQFCLSDATITPSMCSWVTLSLKT